MKRLIILVILGAVMLSIPTVLSAQETDPAAVIEGQAAAINAGDIEATMAYFTNDAVITVVYPPPAPSDVYTGAAEVRAWFEDLAAGNFVLESTILKVEGNIVTANEKSYSDFSRELGIAPLEGITEYQAQDGKIKAFTWTITDESWAKLQAAMAPEELPETEGFAEILARGAPIHGANGLMFDRNDQLYIASVGGREILVMDPDTGQILDRLGQDEGVESPDDLVFGPDGSLYWTALFTGEVGRISPDGVKTGQFVAPGVNPITFSDDGRLFVALDFLGDGLYELDPELIKPPRLIIETLGFLNGFDFWPDGFLYGPIYTQGKVVRINVDTGEMSTVADGFSVAPAVKFDSQGRLYTGDSVTGEVFRIDPAGQKEVIATGLVGLDNLAFDSHDRLFVSGSDDGYIAEVLAGGTNRLVSEGGMIVPQGVTVLDQTDGPTLFVADMMTVRQFDGATGEKQTVYRSSMGGPGLANPVTVTVDGDHIVISSWFANMVQLWNPATNEILEAYDDFDVPLNAIRFQGDLVVAELGTGSIVRANPAARVTLVEGLAVPAGLAANENNLWASDWASGQVLQIVADGEPLSEPIPVATGLSFPEGLAVAADGTLLVVESGVGRLSSIHPETGQVRSIAEGLELGALGPEGMPPTWTFNGVAVDSAGTIYVTGDKTNVLYRIEEPAPLPETGGVTLPTFAIILTLATVAILGGVGLALQRRRSSQ